ncbi:MAG TPA: YraN family protein [Gammaproteobacteria bacterium]|nr:YraN family protein [Gammaproteobacteria bacterium]
MAKLDGRYWEERARRYLRERGLRPLLTRYRCRYGELDLVCMERTTLVIVEVRARAAGSLVSAVESIGAQKRARVIRATHCLLRERPQWNAWPVRFDVVAIEAGVRSRPRITWIRNAFQAD